MTERSRLWDGTATGDASEAPYDLQTELAQVLSAIAAADPVATYRGGVFRGVLNKYAGTPGTDAISIDTGRAIVYGTWHENDAAVNVSVTRPAASDRYDIICLRKSWSAQTVRITRNAGVEGAGAGSPTLTNTAGTTWDVPLYRIKITAAGVVTIDADLRSYIPVHGDQSAESGTKHAYGNISGTPAISGTVTSVTPGAAGTAGASGTISDGAHQHPLTGALIARKTSNEVYGGGDVLHSDADLVLTLEATSVYWFEATIFTAGPTGYIRAGFTLPAGGSLIYNVIGQDDADPTILESIVENTLDPGTHFGIDATIRALRISGTISTANAGAFTFRWAGASATVYTGSVMYAVKK